MLKTDYKFTEVYPLASQVDFTEEKVNFKGIFGNENGEVVLLAFKAGQQLSTHLAPAEVMVTLLEGEIDFTIFEDKHRMKTGDFLLLGKAVPHSVVAIKDSKVMLTKIQA